MAISKRLLLYPVIAAVLLLIYSQARPALERKQSDKLELAREQIVFVDQASQSPQANGSIEHPFKDITSALAFIKDNNSFRIVKLRPGIYREYLILPENLILAGEREQSGKPLVAIQAPEPGRGKVLTANHNNQFLNLEVKDGKYNLYIPQDKSGVVLSGCQISGASKWGIFNEVHSDSSPTLRIIKTRVTHSRRQGAYLQKSTLEIKDSEFSQNGEEGIDLHTGMNSKISGTKVRENGEGGLETEIGDISLTVTASEFSKNGASGINLQSFQENSSVQLAGNNISNNSDFGVRCALHAPIHSPYFRRMVEIADNNHFQGNGKTAIDPNCKKR